MITCPLAAHHANHVRSGFLLDADNAMHRVSDLQTFCVSDFAINLIGRVLIKCADRPLRSSAYLRGATRGRVQYLPITSAASRKLTCQNKTIITKHRFDTCFALAVPKVTIWRLCPHHISRSAVFGGDRQSHRNQASDAVGWRRSKSGRD